MHDIDEKIFRQDWGTGWISVPSRRGEKCEGQQGESIAKNNYRKI